MYLNYDQDKEFVIDFEFVWKYLEFTRKDSAKKLLVKHFKKDIDYIENLAPPQTEINNQTVNKVKKHGGNNKEYIYLSVNTFKRFCLYSDTKKSHIIHDYYIKLENLLQQTLDEETQELRMQLLKNQEIIEEKNEIIMNKIEEYNKLNENHKRILYKRNKHKLMKGNCFYIIKNNDFENKLKFGISSDLNSRYSQYQTYDITDFLYIVYTKNNKLLENCISTRFEKNLKRYNSEWLCDIEINDIIVFIEFVINLLQLDTKIYTNINDILIMEDNENYNNFVDESNIQINLDEQSHLCKNIEQYNLNALISQTIENKEQYININIIENIEQENNSEELKKCNKCLITMSKTSFNKDKTKKDGLHTICRLCEKESKKKYKETKKETMKEITEKKCSTCDIVKDISNFSEHLYTKDGYVSHCKECVKNNSNNKRTIDKENNIRYKCGRCGFDYSRKDVLIRHQKTCMNN